MFIKEEVESHGIKMSIVPVGVLNDIKEDILNFKEKEHLNGFQKWITNEAYVLELPDPEPDFTAKSIVITATPFRMIKAFFKHKNKQAYHIFEFAKDGTQEFITDIFTSHGYKLQNIPWFPRKRLAVRSGLTEYGRNNITYADGMGSYFGIETYKSDMPCGEYTWREVKNMTVCDNCGICIDNCPTGSIRRDRFLIDNEICLSHIFEMGQPLPDGLPKLNHHRLGGCYCCQDMCPKNLEILSNITETVEFSEEETNLLLSGTPIQNLPQNLSDKIHKYYMNNYYDVIPQNLDVLFQNV
ncbi:MAG: 4Fe-4S binding protein [Oscillospiraceae bacterium]|nr:4Fe-4S binding protein [Oscillospiraceae bacterium]